MQTRNQPDTGSKSDPSAPKPGKPAPLETKPGEQIDDNIDDLGRRKDGSRMDQPGATPPAKP